VGFRCFFGFHKYRDRIKITGKIKKEGMPVCIYQECSRCGNIGKKVNCYINVSYKENNK